MKRMKKDLKDLERTTYRSYFQDGLIDIGLGLVVLSFGLGMVMDFPMTAVCGAVLVPLVMALKRTVTYPRIGYVQFTKERQNWEQQGLQLSLVLGVGALAMVLMVVLGASRFGTGWQDWVRLNIGAVLGALFALGIVAGAVVFGIRRFFAYAALVFTTFAIMEYVGAVHPGYVVAAGGAAVTAGGIWVLTRFVIDHPVLEGGE